MAKDSNDPEIVVSAGKMAGMFVVLVAVCALFFGFGYSIGKEAAVNASNGGAPAVVVVGQRAASTAVSAMESQPVDPASAKPTPAPTSVPTQIESASTGQPQEVHPLGLYFLQVAAVTKQEDAEALVSALKKKDYAVFSTNTSPADRLYHVQIGPFNNQKDVEGLRAKLISAGYNPIVKRQG